MERSSSSLPGLLESNLPCQPLAAMARLFAFFRVQVSKDGGGKMLKKSLLAVFGLAMALAFATPEKAQAEVAIGVGVSIGGPIYARPVYSYPYAYGYYAPAPRPVYVYPRPYVYPHRVFYGRVYARPYLRHERFENRERYEHRDRFYRDRR
jgi:hypothetical protein